MPTSSTKVAPATSGATPTKRGITKKKPRSQANNVTANNVTANSVTAAASATAQSTQPTTAYSVSKAPSAATKASRTTPKPSHGAGDATAAPQQPKATESPTPWRIVLLPVERIEPSPYQPRLTFDAVEMSDLVASVRSKGVQQPIIVRTCQTDKDALQNGTIDTTNRSSNSKVEVTVKGVKNGAPNPNLVRYELIAGERRLRACKEAGRKTIPAIIRDDLSDAECAELALLENVQRSNLSVIEEACGYKRLMLQFRMKEERIAKKVGKSVGTIRDLLKLLQLPEAVQKFLAEKKLTASHGQQLLPLAPYERVCILVAERAVCAIT